MDKAKIVTVVVKKIALDKKLQKIIKNTLKSSEILSGEEFVAELKVIAKENKLSDEEFSKIIESLVKQHQIYLKDHRYKEELKKLISTPPLKTYLKGLIF